jgi:hypothetical protein
MTRSLSMVRPSDPVETGTAGPGHQEKRGALNFVIWRARLAAPGSRFERSPLPIARSVRPAAVPQPATPATERRAA